MRRVGEVVVHHACSTDPIASTVDQDPRCIHKVSISSHVRLLIQPWHSLLQERLQFSIGIAERTVQTKLGNPDRSSSGYGTGRIDVRFKVRSTSIFVTVPMKVDEVDDTACTIAQEVLQIQ